MIGDFEYEEMLYLPDEELEYGDWGAGEQIGALKFYLKPEVEVLAEYEEPNYQGQCYAILKYKDVYILWRDSFGSCSGCDLLDGKNKKGGYNYIKATLTEGNCKRFTELKEMRTHILNSDEYDLKPLKEHIEEFTPKEKGDKYICRLCWENLGNNEYELLRHEKAESVEI